MDNHILFQNFVAFIADVHRVQYDLTKESRPNKLTPLQYSILEYIAVSSSVTPSDISTCFHISMPNTSRELRKLTEQGFIERKESEQDRRKQYIQLSADGQEIMNKVFQQVEARFSERIGPVSAVQIENIAKALAVLKRDVFY